MFFNTLCLVWIILSVSGLCYSQLEEVDAKSAGNYCEHGLATYGNFKLANLSVLKNGQSGWLSGYAELSSPLSIESCFNITNMGIGSNLSLDSRENMFGECMKYCNYTRYDYIGLQNSTCFCVEHSKLVYLSSGYKISLSECQRACRTTFNFHCEKYFVTYRKINQQINHGIGQCVYTYLRGGTIWYSGASCHTISEQNMQGYICQCETQCNKLSHFPEILVENVSNSWTEAYSRCASKNNSLITMAYSDRFSKLIDCCNLKYWTGGFRAILPVNYNSSNKCLAVTKVESDYFLDVFDCSTSKTPICSTPSSHISSATFSTPNEVSTEFEKQSKENNQIAVAVGLTIGILAAMVIIVCVVARCIKTRNTSSGNKILLTHENDFTVSGTEDYAVIDTDRSAIKAECPQGETFVKDSKNKPIKPERLTLRRQKKAIQAYENFQLVPVEDKKTSENRSQDDQYDRVDLTRPYHQNDETVPLEADLHVYNHTICNDDNYDVTLPRQKTSLSNQNYDTTQPGDINLYNTPNMASVVKDADCLNTLKTVEGSNSVSSGNKSDYVYVDDDKITLDDGTNSSAIHVYSEMDYDVVGFKTTNTQKAREQDDIVYEVVHKEYNNI